MTRLAILVIAAVLAVPLASTAQTCPANWTDHPAVAGETPIRAAHINEIRECLTLIMHRLGLVPPPPPSTDIHYKVTSVSKLATDQGHHGVRFDWQIESLSDSVWIALDITFRWGELPTSIFSPPYQEHCFVNWRTPAVGQSRMMEVDPVVCQIDNHDKVVNWHTVIIEARGPENCQGCGEFKRDELPE
jgi:hypothetical protein